MYQSQSKAHSDPENVCIGADCFRGTFLVAAGLCIVAGMLAVGLLLRTKSLYEGLHAKLRQDKIAQQEEAQLIQAVH